jgi:thymidine phosphorylase
MNQPLGRSIGTGIEVIEAREFLHPASGHAADARARELLIAIASVLVEESGVSNATERIRAALENGSAYEKFLEMIAAQKGDTRAFERMVLGEPLVIPSRTAGYVSAIDVVALGHAGRRLSAHDPLGGLRVAVRIGDSVEAGQPLLYAYGHNRADAEHLDSAFTLSDKPVQAPPLVYDTISSS